MYRCTTVPEYEEDSKPSLFFNLSDSTRIIPLNLENDECVNEVFFEINFYSLGEDWTFIKALKPADIPTSHFVINPSYTLRATSDGYNHKHCWVSSKFSHQFIKHLNDSGIVQKKQNK